MKALALLGVAGLGAASLPDANLVLNALMLAVLLFGAPRYFRSKVAEAQLLEKDRTIDTKQQTIDSLVERVEAVTADRENARRNAREAREQADRADRACAEWKAKYEEQTKYTAPQAVEALLHEITRLEVGIQTAIEANSELVMKNLEVLSELRAEIRGNGR